MEIVGAESTVTVEDAYRDNPHVLYVPHENGYVKIFALDRRYVKDENGQFHARGFSGWVCYDSPFSRDIGLFIPIEPGAVLLRRLPLVAGKK